MTCIKFKTNEMIGFLCGTPDYSAYICFEHTTYWFEFTKMFGPKWWRIECGKEIEVEFEFNEKNEVLSNKFLWDIFENMKESFSKQIGGKG